MQNENVMTLQILNCHCPAPCMAERKQWYRTVPVILLHISGFIPPKKHCPCWNDKQDQWPHSASCLLHQHPTAELSAGLPGLGGSLWFPQGGWERPEAAPLLPEMGSGLLKAICAVAAACKQKQPWKWLRCIGADKTPGWERVSRKQDAKKANFHLK